MARNSIWKFLSGEYRKSRESLAIESMNPLRLLTAKEAEMVFDCARRGNYARIQSIYAEIERTDPTLMVCVQRRAAALLELDWKVVRSDERLDRRDWGSLAEDQTAFLETAMARCGNLPETVEHLALAAFRGYSHARPVHGPGMRSVEEFDLLDSWNFCWDRENRQWLWNPDGTSYAEPAPGGRLKAIPKGELATVRYSAAIDWPALMIFLRTYVGERDWGRFLERYGIPPVTITSPEGTNEEEARQFAEAAQDVFEGKSGTLPFGSAVTFASADRGVDPFSQFLDHQQRLVVLMATGGLLTSLAESGSGTLAGNAHMDTWRTIVRRDSRMISNAIQRVACEPMLRAAFPGKPILATWKLETEPDAVPAEVFDLAAKAKSAGLLLDPGEVSEQTGYTVTREEAPQLPMAGFGFNSAPVTNAAPVEPPARERVRAAIRGDIGPVADRVRELLAIEDPGEAREAAAKLAADIPGLMPDDPELADALEREIAEAFAEGASEGGTAENARGGNPDNRGQFSKAEGPHGRPRESESQSHHDRYGVSDEKMLANDPGANAERGRNALEEVLRKKGGYVDDAMYREECGWIRFDWGDPGDPSNDYKGGHGLSHMAAKHPSDLKFLPQIVSEGELYKHEDPHKIYVVQGSRFAVLASLHKGAKKTITEFEPSREIEIARIKGRPRIHRTEGD